MQIIKFAHAIRSCRFKKNLWLEIEAYKRGYGRKTWLIGSPRWVAGLNAALIVREVMQVPVGTMQIPEFADITDYL